MEIEIRQVNGISVVVLIGEIDAKTSTQVQEQILPLAKSDHDILLDMSQVPYMSSAGLRLLVILSRAVAAEKRSLILVGLSEALKDTMSVTGFLNFFEVHDSVDSGLESLRG
jgi:anti-sigma B factor antagonist